MVQTTRPVDGDICLLLIQFQSTGCIREKNQGTLSIWTPQFTEVNMPCQKKKKKIRKTVDLLTAEWDIDIVWPPKYFHNSRTNCTCIYFTNGKRKLWIRKIQNSSPGASDDGEMDKQHTHTHTHVRARTQFCHDSQIDQMSMTATLACHPPLCISKSTGCHWVSSSCHVMHMVTIAQPVRHGLQKKISKFSIDG